MDASLPLWDFMRLKAWWVSSVFFVYTILFWHKERVFVPWMDIDLSNLSKFLIMFFFLSVILYWLFKQALCALSAETENWGKKPALCLNSRGLVWIFSLLLENVKTRGWIYFQQFLVTYCLLIFFFHHISVLKTIYNICVIRTHSYHKRKKLYIY